MVSYKEYVYSFCAFGGLLTLVGTAVLHALAWYKTEDVIGLFKLERKTEWDSLEINLIGSSWLLWIWAGVYLSQIVWLVYGLTFPCRNLAISRLLYATLPPVVHMVYLISNVCIVAWVFVWDEYRLIHWSLFCLLGTAILAPFTVMLMLRAHTEACPRLKTVAPSDHLLLRILAHNGVAVHGAWSAALVLYQISVVITDQSTLPLEDVHLIFLGLILAYILIWFVIDIIACRHFLSWVISPYLTWIILSLGIILHRQVFLDLRFFITILVLVVSAVLGATKVVMVRKFETNRNLTHKVDGFVITSLEKEQLDKVEKIDMINKMFEY